MTGRDRIIVLIVMNVVIAVGVGGILHWSLYEAAFRQERGRLQDLTRCQARLIEAVGRFDAQHSVHDVPGGAFAATLQQVHEAQHAFRGFGTTGELQLVARDEGGIVVLHRSRHPDDHASDGPSMSGVVAEPMRRALAGQSGTLTCHDSSGASTLVAYESVDGLNLGVLASIELAEIRAPFVRASLYAAGACSLLIALGAAAFVRVGNPVLRRLEENERKYRTLFHAAADGKILHDLDGEILEVNPAAARMHGYDRNALIGASVINLIHEDCKYQFVDAMRGASESTAFSLGCKHVRRDGTCFPVEIRVARMTYAGRPAMLAVIRDVSERERAQQVLRQSEIMLASATRLAGVGSYVWDISADKFHVSEEWGRIHGWDETPVSRAGLTRIVRPSDRTRLEQALKDSIAGRRGYELEYWIIRPDTGAERLIHACGEVECDAAGRPVRMFGAVRDITEQRRADEALRSSEQRFRGLVENANDVIYALDLDGKFSYVSPNICEILGYEPAEFLGRHFEEFVHPEDHASCHRFFQRVITTGERVAHSTYRVRHRDGDWRWHTSNASALKNTEGAISGFLGISRDISERRRAEEALQESERFVRTTLDSLSAHIAIVDEAGSILAVNRAWRAFARANGAAADDLCEGTNYFRMCASDSGEVDDDALRFLEGARAVLAGEQGSFEMEYPCHSPREQRWFIARVTRFPEDGPARVVIAHENITKRKQVEQALREQKELLNHVLATIPHAVFWKDRESRYLGCNAVFARLAGLKSCEDIVGKTDYDLPWCTEESDWYRQCDAEVMRSGMPKLNIEETQRSAASETNVLLTSKVPLCGPDGQVCGILGVFADITEQKRAELRIRESEERHRGITDAAQDAVITASAEGVIEIWNSSATRIFGFRAEEACGRNMMELIVPGEYHAAKRRGLLEFARTGTGPCVGRSMELIALRKGGEQIPVEVSVSGYLGRHGRMAVAVIRDISERKQIQVRLARVQAAVSAAVDPILIIESDGQVSYANDSAIRRLGRRLESMNRLGWQSMLADGEVEASIREASESGRVWMGETLLTTPWGEQFAAELRVAPILVDGDSPSGMVLLVHDLTARKQAEAEQLNRLKLEQDRNHLRDALVAFERVLGVVGHELRTPLASMRITTEMLLADSAGLGELQSFMATLHEEVLRMTEMVNDTLEVARLNSGAARWHWSKVSLRRACSEAIQTMRPLINAEQVALSETISPPDLSMRGDAAAIRRLVLNLLSNAQKHTEQGRIEVRARSLRQDEKDWIELVVSDTGEGMPPEIASRLGVPFALNSGLIGESHVRGGGLGLAICRGIVEAHGGNISVRTAQGRGTSMRILLRADLNDAVPMDRTTAGGCEVQLCPGS